MNWQGFIYDLNSSLRNHGVFVYVNEGNVDDIPKIEQKPKLAAISDVLGRLNKVIKRSGLKDSEIPSDVYILRSKLRSAARTLNRQVEKNQPSLVPYRGWSS